MKRIETGCIVGLSAQGQRNFANYTKDRKAKVIHAYAGEQMVTVLWEGNKYPVRMHICLLEPKRV